MRLESLLYYTSALLIAAAFVACADASPQERERRLALANTALRSLTEWYGPPAETSASTLARSENEILRAVAARFWSGPQAPQFTNDPRLTESLITFSIDRLRREGLTTAPPLEASFFDGHVVWPLRSVRAGRLPARNDRTLLALLTLEHYLGWPTVQRTLAEFRARFAGRQASASDLIAMAGTVAGRDLTWMEGIFDRATTYDYAIDRVETRPVSEKSYQVDVVVKRHGRGMFTGTSADRTAAYDAGRGVSLLVTFADGEALTEAWDGRDAERHFTYQSAVPVMSAVVDPDGVIAVDQSRANNEWTAADAQQHGLDGAAVAWSLRWAAWLEDRLLLWSVLW